MKGIIFILLVAAIFTGCEKESNEYVPSYFDGTWVKWMYETGFTITIKGNGIGIYRDGVKSTASYVEYIDFKEVHFTYTSNGIEVEAILKKDIPKETYLAYLYLSTGEKILFSIF